MEVLAIIPARGGSKGLPGKNIKPLNGKPLIAYTIAEAFSSKKVNRIVVSTDDASIAEVSKKYGAEVPFLRPQALSNDKSPTVDAVIYTLDRLAESESYIPDLVCLLQCTAPLKTSEHIDGAINKLIASGMDGIVSICETEAHPFWMQVFNGDKLQNFIPQKEKITRRQDLPVVYRLNGAFWIVKTQNLMKEKSLIVSNQTGYVMKSEDSVDIDNELDFKIAELLIKERELRGRS